MEYTCLHTVKNWVYFYFPGSPRIINTADTIINNWHSIQYNSRPMLICSSLVFEWSALYGVPFVHNNWPIIGQELYSLLVCMRLCVDILLNELISFNRTASTALIEISLVVHEMWLKLIGPILIMLLKLIVSNLSWCNCCSCRQRLIFMLLVVTQRFDCISNLLNPWQRNQNIYILSCTPILQSL